MNRFITRPLLLIFAVAAVAYPIGLSSANYRWTLDSTLAGNLFPLLGLLAFTLLWLHSISGVFEPWLRKQFDFDRFVHVTSIMTLVAFLLHPLLLLSSLGFNLLKIFAYYDDFYIWLGIVALLLLITYDIGKWFNKHDFFARNWNKILVISTIGFLISFFHSINLGGDLQSGPLRGVWIVYGVMGILATIYTYGIKRLFTPQYPG